MIELVINRFTAALTPDISFRDVRRTCAKGGGRCKLSSGVETQNQSCPCHVLSCNRPLSGLAAHVVRAVRPLAGGRRAVQGESLKASHRSLWPVSTPRLPSDTGNGCRKPKQRTTMQTKIAAAALVLMAVPAHAGTLKHDMRTYMDLAHKAYIFWDEDVDRNDPATKEAYRPSGS